MSHIQEKVSVDTRIAKREGVRRSSCNNKKGERRRGEREVTARAAAESAACWL